MVRHVTSMLAACALATTASVFAQEQAPGPPAEPANPPAAAPQVPKEVVTGCVVEAKTTTGEKAFLLNKAEGGSAAVYVLAESPEAGPSQSDWEKSVNKKVEVSGPVQQPPGGPSADDGAAGAQKVLRPALVRVETVKVVAETC